MPPKKLTKAEKDRLKQEAERKAKEEEEQRLKEEEEKRKREEEERIQKEEETKKLKAEEKIRFDEETNEFCQIKDKIQSVIQGYNKKEKENKEWQHYISCSKLPFVKDKKALNTYFSLYHEQQKPKSIDESLIRIQDLFKLLAEIEEDMDSIDESSIYLERIHNLINQELDQATLLTMENYDQYIDSETFNLIVERETPLLKYCLWGNIVKNPRLKDFCFKLHPFTLDISKPMLLADIAVRVMYPSYDTLTPLCKTYYPHDEDVIKSSHKDEVVVIEENEAIEEKASDESVAISKSDNNSRVSSAKSLNESMTTKDQDETTVDQSSNENTLNNGDTETTNGKENGSQEKQQPATVEEEIVENIIDMRCYTVVGGGPILLDLLVLPSIPKSVNNWTIKQSTMTNIIRAPDPVDPSGVVPPVHITLGLPQYYYYFSDEESLLLVQWDQRNLVWKSLGGVDNVKFDLSNKCVTFSIRKFAPLAILIDKYVNLPYQSWELLPLGVNHTIYQIASVVEIAIEIKELECVLVKCSEEQIVEKLLNKPMSAQNLIKALQSIGLNFFPSIDAHKYTALSNKDSTLENNMYECMAMSCGGWAFQWSQWNSKISENIVVRGAECTHDKWGLIKDDIKCISNELNWDIYSTSNESTFKLHMKEDDEELDVTLADGHKTHPNLYTTLLKHSSQAVSELVSQTSSLHIETIQKCLMATRPLSAT